MLRISLLLAVVALSMTPAWAQTRQPRCLHGEGETETQAQRREEALDATDLINRLLERRPRDTAYPTWEALGESTMVASLRGMAGPRGDLVRKLAWGRDEPLPGWRIHYVATQDGYAFSLTDSRDPCRLTFTSNDRGMIFEGRPADLRGRPRVIPLDSSQ